MLSMLTGIFEVNQRDFLTIKWEAPSAIIYYVFDILYLDGYDLMRVPVSTRKELLRSVLVPTEDVRLVEHFEKDGQTVYEAAIKNGLEGVVAKRKAGIYEAGKRSKDWLKIKAVNSDEFIICGFTQGTGNRSKTFGALVLGYYDKNNMLQPAGNVGTGFDSGLLLSLKKELNRLTIKSLSFRYRNKRFRRGNLGAAGTGGRGKIRGTDK